MLHNIKKFLVQLVINFKYKRLFSSSHYPTINGWCTFSPKISFGKNTHFNGAKFLGSGSVIIGDNFHSAKGLLVLTENHNWYSSALPYDHTTVKKMTTIGDNVWIGMNVTILPGVKIGEGCIIQAGSVVSKSIPDLAIAGGNPANVIKYRDSVHYFTLKKNAQFH